MRDYSVREYPGTHHKQYLAVLIPWIIKHYGIQKNSSVLDIGCGLGHAVMEFRIHGMCGWGVDNRMMFESWFKTCNIEKQLPFQDNTLDYVFCKSVIEHVRSPEAMVKEVRRVLKPGGRFIVLTPDWMYCYRGFYADCTHVSPYTTGSLAQFLWLNEFDDITAEKLRPSGPWLAQPWLRWLMLIATTILPYRWRGEWKYASRKHLMAMVSGRK